MPPAVDDMPHRIGDVFRPRSTLSLSVTLTPVDDPDDERYLTLFPGEPVVIGRASISGNKNLFPSPTNALFHCPVVSRSHAELKYNQWAETRGQVSLVDRSSMHGTYVNGARINRNQPFHLCTGDVVKFGDRVARGNGETHDGVIVTYKVDDPVDQDHQLPKQPSNHTFTAPDSDISDADDSDDDLELTTSSAQTTPEQTKQTLGTQQSPIDLDEPRPSLRKIITLDDEPTVTTNAVLVPDSLGKEGEIAESISQGAVRRTDSHSASNWLDHQTETIIERVMTSIDVPAASSNVAVDAAYDDEYAESDYGDEFYADDCQSNDGNYPDDPDYITQDRFEYVGPIMMDDVSVSDDSASDAFSEMSDEGPEVMSAKKQDSPELGSSSQALSASKLDDTRKPSAMKSHYDPVRGSQPPETNDTSDSNYDGSMLRRAYGYPISPKLGSRNLLTDYQDSTKWDVPPANYVPFQPIEPYNTSELPGMYPAKPAAFMSVPATCPTLPTAWKFSDEFVASDYEVHEPPAEPVYVACHDASKSEETPRCARDVTDEEHSNSKLEAQCEGPKTATLTPQESTKASPSIIDRMSIPQLVSKRRGSTPGLALHEESVVAARPASKRKAAEISADDDAANNDENEAKKPDQATDHLEDANELLDWLQTVTAQRLASLPEPPRKRSRVEVAVRETGKYALGAALGGIGTFAFLISPLAERILS